MRPKGSCIGIYVLLVGQTMANNLHTHNLNVRSIKVNQKTSQDGHATTESTTRIIIFDKNSDNGPFFTIQFEIGLSKGYGILWQSRPQVLCPGIVLSM